MIIVTTLVLLAIATLVAIVARFVKAPYTVALVLAGLALGSLTSLSPPHLTKELLFGLFLPGLLFEAALHITRDELRQNARAVLGLAVPGVLAGMLFIAAALSFGARALGLGELDFMGTLVFAALIGATDPIAVIALFKQLGAPKRLSVIVEAESLLNDGTAVVFFSIVMTAATGSHPSVLAAAIEFMKVTGGGIVIGALAAVLVRAAMRLANDPMIGVSLTTLAAYGSFQLAERLGLSGVIATVVAGMIVGDAARHGRSIGTTARVSIESFWEYVAFALNSLVFLLIGFEVEVGELGRAYALIALAYLVVTLSRGLLVGAVVAVLRGTSERMPWRWAVILGWGGLRGALSMVLALATPPDFPHRRELVAMTYGVVVLSLVVQGLTIRPLLSRLGLVEANA